MTDTPREPQGEEPDAVAAPGQNQPEPDSVRPADGPGQSTSEQAEEPIGGDTANSAGEPVPSGQPSEHPVAEQPASGETGVDSPTSSEPVPPEAAPSGSTPAQPEQPQTWQPPATGSQPAAESQPAAPASDPVAQQPAAAGQTAPTEPYGAQFPGYTTDAFGRQVPDPAYAPYPPQQDYATQPGQPGQPASGPQAAPRQKRKHGTGVLVAALAVGALIGGASGAGVVGIYAASQGNGTKTITNSGPANITVNDANNATVVTAVANKVSPSVVTIQVTGRQAGGTGSGIILSDDGYVLTNTHVVTLDGEIANPRIQVRANSGKLYDAKVVGTDPISDLAVIKIEGASGLTPATWGDSSKLDVGQTAIAIGAPLGLSGTVTDGIVSALNRGITVKSSAVPKEESGGGGGDNNGNGPFDFWNFDIPGQQQQQQSASSGTIALSVIQTDAPINPGNSGGPLLNSKGQVIGVNVAIAGAGSNTSGGQSGSIGLGFAIPSDLAHRVANELIKDGKASHGLLGATVTDATNSQSATTVGALIDSVTDGGAAQKAGLKKGDIITNFNGFPITGMTDITAQVRALPGGSKTDLTYVRGDQTRTVTVTLGELAQ